MVDRMPWADGVALMLEGQGDGSQAPNNKIEQVEQLLEGRIEMVDHHHLRESLLVSKRRRKACFLDGQVYRQ